MEVTVRCGFPFNESYLISCSSASNSGVLKNSPSVMFRPSQIIFMVSSLDSGSYRRILHQSIIRNQSEHLLEPIYQDLYICVRPFIIFLRPKPLEYLQWRRGNRSAQHKICDQLRHFGRLQVVFCQYTLGGNDTQTITEIDDNIGIVFDNVRGWRQPHIVQKSFFID